MAIVRYKTVYNGSEAIRRTGEIVAQKDHWNICGSPVRSFLWRYFDRTWVVALMEKLTTHFRLLRGEILKKDNYIKIWCSLLDFDVVELRSQLEYWSAIFKPDRMRPLMDYRNRLHYS